MSGEGKKIAMVIAVSDYATNVLKPLSFCKSDGAEMCKVLKNSGYDINQENMLIGEVDGSGMRDAIIEFFQNDKIKALDTVIFYYSGHGVPDMDDTYLAPSNIDVEKPSKRGFSFNELTKAVNKCTSQKIVIILDCCYAGSASISKGGGDASVLGAKAMARGSYLIQGYGKCVLAASQSYQESYGTEGGGQSLFTYHLLNGFKGKKESVNKNGSVTPETLGNYVYVNVTADNPNQKPIIKTEGAGEIILSSYPGLADSDDVDPITKDVITLLEEGKKSLLLNQFDEALGYFNQALDVEPDNAKIWSNLGRLKEKLEDKAGALECFDKVIELMPNDGTAWFNKGTVFLKNQDYDAARMSFEKAAELEPDDPDLWHNMAVTYSKLHKNRKVTMCFKMMKRAEKKRKKL